MRKCQADYEAIERALCPYQQHALTDYALARGISHWRDDTAGCVVAVALAVANRIQALDAEGVSGRSAYALIAVAFDLDPDTVRRQVCRRDHLSQSASIRISEPDY